MKKFGAALATMILTATTLVMVGASPAAAAGPSIKNIPPGWALWTRERCEAGKQWTMHRMHHGNEFQGRRYVYWTEGRFCAFAVDRLPGSHRISVFATSPKTGSETAYDDGQYEEYAGALAAPKGPRFAVRSTLAWKGKLYQVKTLSFDNPNP